MHHRDGPEHWRRQAQETRQLATMVSLNSDKLFLLKMAGDYDSQAKAAEESQPPADSKLVLHRAVVRESQTLIWTSRQSEALMRATNAELRAIIKECMTLIEHGRESLCRVDVLLRTGPVLTASRRSSEVSSAQHQRKT
jgi:hypothetical protein